ncbi:STAS domain-containing protein [Streptomyces sp. NPDC020489]|uniref:STAS domain-containing protein n=1 Tax=Streptomyces sp. NPDC020489 TaxID=3365077 RepID=UPI0037B29E47
MTERSFEPDAGTSRHLLEVTAHALDGVQVLTLAGEIDFANKDVLRQGLDSAAATGPRIVLDLQQVTFMDSSGLNVLIAAHQNATGAGGWLRLAGMPAAVQRTVQIVGLDSVIACYDTLPDALTG